MKKIICICLTLFSFAFTFAQDESDKILGTWVTGSGLGHVKITKYGNKYAGKIVWIKDPIDASGKVKTDNLNPDKSKRKDPLMGLTNLIGFKYMGNRFYKEGTIYDPKNGKTYSAVMTLIDNDNLDVRGYIGISLIGRTDKWKRVQEKK